MDLTRPVTYRGLTLTGAAGGPGGNHPIVGMRLTRARYTEVPAVGYTEKRSLGQGLDASDVYLGGRMMQLTGEVFGEDKAMLFDQLDIIRDVFTASSAFNAAPGRQGYLPLQFEQPTRKTTDWPTGYITKVLDCRPVTQNDHDIVFGAIGGPTAKGYVVPFTVSLQAKDPFFHTPIPRFVSADTDGSDQFQNRGLVASPIRIELHVDVDDERTFVLTTPRGTLTLDIPDGDPRIVIADGKSRLVSLGGNVAMDLLDIVGDWPVVLPTDEGDDGETFSWDMGGGGYGAESVISWPELWY